MYDSAMHRKGGAEMASRLMTSAMNIKMMARVAAGLRCLLKDDSHPCAQEPLLIIKSCKRTLSINYGSPAFCCSAYAGTCQRWRASGRRRKATCTGLELLECVS